MNFGSDSVCATANATRTFFAATVARINTNASGPTTGKGMESMCANAPTLPLPPAIIIQRSAETKAAKEPLNKSGAAIAPESAGEKPQFFWGLASNKQCGEDEVVTYSDLP
ncbi:MAG: hypothetical protein SGI99_00255 [Pseudomonadota bacterium]|nr:hypothetical protein [Pseudomonadota bacterium]